MNQAAKLVTDSINGESFATFTIRGKAYTIYPPAIKVYSRALSHYAHIELPEQATNIEAISIVASQSDFIIQGLSILMSGDCFLWRLKANKYAKILRRATEEELCNAFRKSLEMLGGESFFACAALARNLARMAATPKL